MSGCGCGEGDFEGPWWRFPPLRNGFTALAIALAAWLAGRAGLLAEAVEIGAYGVAIVVGAWYWAREGLEALLQEREVGISLLMLAATAGAGALGLWEEAAALVVLYAIAEGVEEYAFARTRHAIRALLDLAPKQARLLTETGEERLVPAERLRPGDRFVVLPGEAVATDGIIETGRTSLDESPVTGESVPVDKGPGDAVFAASINGAGRIVVRATAAFRDNTLARIVELVERAQDQKGRAQAWMERFGRRYSPAVLATAAGLALVPLLGVEEPRFWWTLAVTLLVAAAPCALVISLPIAMAAGISGAGKRGILIKGGAHLEHLGQVDIVAFDKTGTLTLGRPRLLEQRAVNGDERTLLAVAAALEAGAQHPLARAVLEAAEAAGVEAPRAQGHRVLSGLGVEAEIDGRLWRLGKPDLFRDGAPLPSDLEAEIEAQEGAGRTVVLVGDASQVIGWLALADTPRENAAATIAALHRLGIRTVMLTGDNPRAARHIAAQLGIDEVHAGLLPEDKVRIVEDLARDAVVVMVGDGINDAPALAAATCGVAMGTAGTDAAIEAADVALMADDLSKLVEAVHLGRKARRVSLENIVFALTVLVILVPSALSGLISITATVLAHEASELLAVANGLRAGRVRIPPKEA